MKFFDCHCDTLLKMYREKKSFYNNGFDYDFSKFSFEDEPHVVCAVFNDGSLFRKDILSVFTFFKEQTKSMHNVKFYLAVEGLGNQPDFCIGDIELYKSYGMRMASLCWNNDNILCGGAQNNSCGLSALGKETIKEMSKNSVMADVSHASDKTMYDILKISNVCVCASHSNSRFVYAHNRNLADDQFKAIASNGGVVGVNFYPDFVMGENSDVDDVISHIEHFLEIGGENNIGIGSDFDGIDKKCKNLEDFLGIYKLRDRLLAKGHNQSFINKLFFENFSEIFKKYE